MGIAVANEDGLDYYERGSTQAAKRAVCAVLGLQIEGSWWCGASSH